MKKSFFFVVIIFCSLLVSNTTFAQPTDPGVVVDPQKTTVGPCIGADCTYELLEPLPGLEKVEQSMDVGKWVNTMVRVIIGIIGVLAVVMIVVGGIQYMTTDAIGKKESGKETVQGALFGVVLALAAYIILRTINPQLVSLDLAPGTANTAGVSVKLAEELNIIQKAGQRKNADGQIACIRNNNYGNITGNDAWEGKTGIDTVQGTREDGTKFDINFVVFSDPVWGIRAYMKNLKTQYERDPKKVSEYQKHFKTLRQLFGYYAVGDKTDNPTAYMNQVSKETGIGLDTDIGLVKSGVVDKKVLYPLARAQFKIECAGKVTVTDAQLDEAYQKAFQ